MLSLPLTCLHLVEGVKDEIVAVLRGAGAHKECELCVQAIFLLLDVLKKWAEESKGTAAWSASGGDMSCVCPACAPAQHVHQPSTCTGCLPAFPKTYWHRQQLSLSCIAGAAGVSSGSIAPTSSAQHVHQLLASIPQDLLAQAAAQCGAHARALLHYETHLRSKEGGGLNPVAHKNIYYSDDEVSFLQVSRGT